ncbi:FHA domain-containing protein [Anaerosporobacter faecicola]|uniref:FHA domain-containing protein n=1 Tax=Anaerosporobacter faecicola TaxID=2718714 RepID=UPI0014387291|nr:FHA domain-containing protein [Anaerosporobacter faecicola]
MISKIVIGIGIACISFLLCMLRHRRRKQIQKRNQAAFDIIKEEALCNALVNPVLDEKQEDQVQDKRYHLEDRQMLQLVTIQAKKKVNYIFSLEKIITFGRNPKTSDVCLKDPMVSGIHCTIFKNQQTVWIKDMGSSNGTIIKRKGNYCVLGNEEAIELKNKDLLQIGEVTFRIELFFINKRYL